MQYRGLFVGIDRYNSTKINELTCAKRDAEALYSLFFDNLGEGAYLLTDSNATKAAIKARFQDLSRCGEEDVVVIAFSGHGSETHELVPYDADPSDIAATGIPLKLFTEWFSKIPAKRLICVLDLCFSGGAGAKVLKVDTHSKSTESTQALIEQLSGDGRLILTACSATEEAWESQRLSHGFLTYYLLEALQGADEVRNEEKISIYRLLEYVSTRVTDGAARGGKSQHPQLLGNISGNLTWPVFKPGKKYFEVFPERKTTPVTSDIYSLTSYGFPQELIKKWASSITSLNQLQIDAINSFNLLKGEHLIVSSPTSSGKTMIGELAALKGALDHKRSFFLLPLKALVNDKHKYFSDTYSSYGIRTIRVTGEMTDEIPQLMRGQYDICLMTYEKFAVLILSSKHILDQVNLIVIDEAQMIADKTRGLNLEFTLTLLLMRRQQGIEPQLIALSAVIGDTNGLERWLGARLLRRNERPVPLNEGLMKWDGSFRFLDSDSREQMISDFIQPLYNETKNRQLVIPLVQRLVAEGKQVIVFRETRGEARHCAFYLSKALGLPAAQETIDALPNGDPSKASGILRDTLAGGVAFHISDLDREERLTIEENFRKKNTPLRVIAATTTLAMGINTPAEAVVIVGLEHKDKIPEPYSVAEYKNIVGRAGRLGQADQGISYLVTMNPNEEQYYWKNYVTNQPEDLTSRFLARNTDPCTLIVRVLVAIQHYFKDGMTSDEIVLFLENSFGAFQEKQKISGWNWNQAEFTNALNTLIAHQLIKIKNEGRYVLTELGWLTGWSCIEVQSVVRLVRVISALNPLDINAPTLLTLVQLTDELDQVRFPINKKSTHAEPAAWQNELDQQGVPWTVLQALSIGISEQSDATLRAKKAVACLIWITGKAISEIETDMTRFGGGLNGAAGPLRNVTSRTCDFLPIVARVAEIIHTGLDLQQHVARLIVRLEIGIPGSVIDIAKHTKTGVNRSDFQKLIANNLFTIDSIEKSSDEILLKIFTGNKNKLALLRDAVKKHKSQINEPLTMLILPKFEE